MSNSQPNRRDLLTGRAVRDRIEEAQDALADAVSEGDRVPTAGPTVRLAVKGMATEFGVLMNPGPASQVAAASEALEVVAAVERQLTVYREDGEVSRLNATAAERPVVVEEGLFSLLALCEEVTRMTGGAFDAATQAQIALWRRCRDEDRVPTDEEVEDALYRSGMGRVKLDTATRSVRYDRPGVGFNFGAIGKGWALDRMVEVLRDEGGGMRVPDEAPSRPGSRPSSLKEFCLHGGHSSVLARGRHHGLEGWPVGIGNPLFTSRRLGTILLKDRALGTSGSNIQFYRHGGKRYGHILDPRTARPAGELLSVSVVAPTAAVADALSTAFFVLGVEKTLAVCDNQPLIGALLIPPPLRGGRLEPVAVGLSEDLLFLDPDQATVVRTGGGIDALAPREAPAAGPPGMPN